MSPEIRFLYSWFLDPLFALQHAAAAPDAPYPSREATTERLHTFVRLWNEEGEMMKHAMQESLGLSFFPNVVDVHVVGAGKRCFSSPVILVGTIPDESLVDVLTHELLHLLLNDNTVRLDLRAVHETMFPGLETPTRNHVLVHAAHRAIYLDTLHDPARLERNKLRDADSPAYMDAWRIVEERGHADILEELRTYYQKSGFTLAS